MSDALEPRQKGSGFVTLRAAIAAIGLGAAWGGALLALAAAAEMTPARPDPAVVGTDYPAAKAARIGGDEKQTRFVMDFDRKVDLVAFALADPYRVVIDLPQVSFRLPKGAGEQGQGLIKTFRYGLIMQGGSRIVLDTTGPVKVEKAFAMPPENGQPAKL